MVEVAILLVSLSIFFQWTGLGAVLFVMHRNKKKSIQLLTEIADESRKNYQELLSEAKRPTPFVSPVSNFWGSKN